MAFHTAVANDRPLLEASLMEWLEKASQNLVQAWFESLSVIAMLPVSVLPGGLHSTSISWSMWPLGFSCPTSANVDNTLCFHLEAASAVAVAMRSACAQTPPHPTWWKNLPTPAAAVWMVPLYPLTLTCPYANCLGLFMMSATVLPGMHPVRHIQ